MDICCQAIGNPNDTSASITDFIFSAGSPLAPYAQWKYDRLGDANASDMSDPDKDALPTLAEYGLTLPPEQPSLPPAMTLFPYAEGDRLRMLLTRDPARNDVTIKVRAAPSPDGPWTNVATSTLGTPFVGPGYVGGDDSAPGLKTVEVRDIVNRADAPQRFLKVEVSL